MKPEHARPGPPRVLARTEAEIGAAACIPAPQAEVFAFLSDLENHWRLTDRFVAVLDLAGPPGARHGGRVRIRGPLGLRRTAVTRVLDASEPAWLRGVAEIRGTTARVQWSLESCDGSTDVRLEAAVLEAQPLDRLVLALGGRWWLRRRFHATLECLVQRFRAPAQATLAS